MDDITDKKLTQTMSAGNHTVDSRDAGELVELTGHAQELTRKFSTISMLALAFSILGTWGTLAQSMDAGLSNGGPATIMWGFVLVWFCNMCVALSLAELCSAFPTALGQAYWVYRLWPTPTGRFISYFCAWTNMFGWWTLTASQVAFMGEFMLSLKVLDDNEWGGITQGWLNFVVYLGVTALFTGINLVACRKDPILPWFNNATGASFILLFFVFAMALLIGVGTDAGLQFESANFAFGTWINNSGWPDAVTFFIGLVQAAYALTAFDSVIHMVEEMPSPSITAPRVIWLSVALGGISGWIFMLVCLFCVQDVDALLESPTGLPFVELIDSVIGTAGATALLALFVISGLAQGTLIATTGSRLTWSFARDDGLPFSRFFSRVSPSWHVPARATILQGILIGLVGVLYLFATTVLEAILSVATIALTISYAIPIAVLLYVGRDALPSIQAPNPAITADSKSSLSPPPTHDANTRTRKQKKAYFVLPPSLAKTINIISLVYCTVSAIFFFFPSSPNPTTEDMNYAIAVFGVMVVVSLGFWVLLGRKVFLKGFGSEERMREARGLEGG